MSTIHLHQTTTSTPEQYVAGLTELGPGRSNPFWQQRRRVPQGAFMRAVTESFGPEQARVAAEDWVDELEFVDIL
jgi:cytochrome P450